MKKSKFVKSTIILIIGGFITKFLGMLIKVIITRSLDSIAMGIYMLVNPTFMLLITLATLGLPVAISKLVSEDLNNNRSIVISSIPIVCVMNIILMSLMFCFSKFIAFNLLNEPRTYYPLMCLAFVLPFISISSILRGYFFGKERMFVHVFSNILEDVAKLIAILIFIPYFILGKVEFAVCFLILTNIISEITSIIVMLVFLPKGGITKKDLSVSKKSMFNILEIGLPTTSTRLIGCFGMFLEPIILTYILVRQGYSNEYIVSEFGILSGYVVPLILLPAFFTGAISQALLPVVSNNYANKRFDLIKIKVKQGIFYSLIIGFPATLLLFLFPEFFLNFIFNTTDGVMYIKFLAPVFLLFYIQAPLTSCMQGMNMASDAMKGTFKSMIIKLIVLSICCFEYGIWGLIISNIVNVLYVTIHHFYYVFNKLNTISS